MRRFGLILGALVLLVSSACDDEPGGPGINGGDATDGDIGGDTPSDALPDTPVDGGDDVVPDTIPDTPTPDADADAGQVAFRSCEADPGGEVCGNGLDDDCDGSVDEACNCAEEATQNCYLGAASDLEGENTRCQAGTQTCQLEFWTACEGAVGPIDEDCNTPLDDDCNGVVNDPEICETYPPEAICPEDFEGPVLDTYTLTGSYNQGGGLAIEAAFWTQVSAPPGHSRDIQLNGTEVTFFADVAGSYVWEFYVENEEGVSDSCQTTFTATTADILRVEMFWNPDYVEGEGLPPDQTDFDLYLAQDPQDGDLSWFYYRDPPGSGVISGNCNPDSCNWTNCSTCPIDAADVDDPIYADSPCQRYATSDRVRECLCRERLSDPPPASCAEDICPGPSDVTCAPPDGPVASDWGVPADPLDDPRLDLDDREGKGPENINIRHPEPGTYRVAVHFFDAQGFGTVDENDFRHAVAAVRVICGGNVVFASEELTMASPDRGGTSPYRFDYWWHGDFWEVGDLTISYSGETVNCDFEEIGTEGDRRVCRMCYSDGGCAGDEGKACGGTGSACDGSSDCDSNSCDGTGHCAS